MRLITTFFILFASFTTFAQTGTNFSFTKADTTIYVCAGDDDLEIIEHLYMLNSDMDTTEVSWLVSWDIPDEWSLSFCDEEFCYPLDGTNSDNGGPSFLPGQNYMYDWHLWVQHDQKLGSGSATITITSATDIFFNQEMVVNIEVVDATSTYCIVDIENTTVNNAIKVYPNPTTDLIKIDLNQNIDLDKIIMTNVNGQIVKSLNASENLNNFEIDIKDLEVGNYTLSILNEMGTVISSQIVNIQ